MKILTVLGTRPEIIRLSRVIEKLDAVCEHILVHTGQNYDPNLNEIFFQQLGVRAPDEFLGAKGPFGEQVGIILSKIEQIMLAEKPDKFLVLGDTNSALAAIVAKRLGIPVYHMEAGNRCYDDRVPEEVDRRIIDHSSDVLLPYTERSRQNLLKEGIPGQRIYVTGNPILEVIQHHAQQIENSNALKELNVERGGYFLVTLHRAENVDTEPRLRQFASALEQIQKKYQLSIVVSTHPRTRSRFEAFGISLENHLIRFLEPFGFFDFVSLEQQARCVLSDSGTVQEECSIFKVPNVTLRDVTERPETIECGSNILSGADPDSILRCLDVVLSQPPSWEPPIEYLAEHVSQTVTRIFNGIPLRMKQSKTLPLVSIITPAYNGAAYIEELILSVKSQDYPNIEHIIIDDGSWDDGVTVSILQRYPHLRWWSRANRGQYATMNEGLNAANGEYICFISADDYMVDNAMHLATDWLSSHTEFDGVYGLTSYVTENGEPFPMKHPFRRAPLRYYPYFTQIQHCSLYVSRQTLLRNNLELDPGIRFVGDYDWILRMIKAGIRIGFIDATLSTIRVHENQMSAQNRAMMSKEQSEIANRNGFGGFRFMFYITVLHVLNFAEQLRVAFKKNQFTGVKDFLHDWIRDKLLPRLVNKP